VLAIKQVLAFSPYALWLDADAVFARFDVPVSLCFLSRCNHALLKQYVNCNVDLVVKVLHVYSGLVHASGRPRGWTPPLPRQTVSLTLQPHQLLIPAPFQDLKSVLGGWFFAL